MGHADAVPLPFCQLIKIIYSGESNNSLLQDGAEACLRHTRSLTSTKLRRPVGVQKSVCTVWSPTRTNTCLDPVAGI
jgi:hypothetical protein